MTDHDPLCPLADPSHFVTVDKAGEPFGCTCEEYARVRADERERIAQAIETQPIDAWGSQAPRGPVTLARHEAFLRSASIARGEQP